MRRGSVARRVFSATKPDPVLTALRAAAPMRAPSTRRGNPEERVQLEVVAHLRRAGVRFFHVPNSDGRRGARNQGKLVALGVEKGVPDIVIITPPPCGGFVHAALELKSDTGRATPEQREWLKTLDALGWATAVTKGLEASLAQLRAWGYIDEEHQQRRVA